MRIAVFTSLFGDKDKMIPVNPKFKKEGDWFLFTDCITENKDYKIVKINSEGKNKRRISREFKIRPHLFLPDYQYHIYIDANIELLVSPNYLIKTYLANNDIAALAHPWRNCIYEEFKECLRIGVADWDLSHEQSRLYRRLGYPENNGLTENGVILRRNNNKIKLFNEFWMLIYDMFAERDQFSFCFCAWRLKLDYNIINTIIREEENKIATEFKLINHLI